MFFIVGQILMSLFSRGSLIVCVNDLEMPHRLFVCCCFLSLSECDCDLTLVLQIVFLQQYF